MKRAIAEVALLVISRVTDWEEITTGVTEQITETLEHPAVIVAPDVL